MKQYILAVLSVLALTRIAIAQTEQYLVVRLVDASGAAIPNGQVAAILKSGAYQDAKFENDEYKCDRTSQCIKIFAAAPGFEASVKKYPAGGGTITITPKPSATKSSAIIHGGGPLPGIEGTVNPIFDSLKRLYLYADKIGLEQNGRPAQQPITFTLNHSINAMSPTGGRFKIWVVDITQEVSVLEYSLPK